MIYGITPFNFPLNLVAHKVAPALAAGNSIIIKPSQRTPLTALLLGEVFLESGLPKSALQIVPMDVKYIDAIFDDERINMISFTGSAEVGWDVKSKAGKKMVALELGGNAPVIVDESADLKKSLEKTRSAHLHMRDKFAFQFREFIFTKKSLTNGRKNLSKRAQKSEKGKSAGRINTAFGND